MSSNDLTVDSIIKKYEKRQEQLSYSALGSKLQQIDTSGQISNNPKYASSGVETPEFSNFTKRKQKKDSCESVGQRTQNKRDNVHSHSRNMSNQEQYELYHMRRDYDLMVRRLQKTEEQLQTYEKNYSEMWRKYEMLLKEGKKQGQSAQLEQKLRPKEVAELQGRIESFERQIHNLKECLAAKDSNLSAVKDKLREKSQRIQEVDRLLETVNSELQMIRAKQTRDQDIEDSKNLQTHYLVDQLRGEISKLERLLKEKDQEKKELLLELENGLLAHKEELQLVRTTFDKVQEEYKEWIDDAGKEKLKLIQEYEHILRENNKLSSGLNSSNLSLEQLQMQLTAKNRELQEVMASNTQLQKELKAVRSEADATGRVNQELIVKISTLENSMIEKVDSQRVREDAYDKIKGLYRAEQEKNREMNSKYSTLNTEFQELKSKCTSIFSELSDRKNAKENQGLEVIRLRKDILHCKEQLQKTKNNEMALSTKLNQAVATLKKKTMLAEEEKQELMTELLAERLEKARLKEELADTKISLKKEYDLSIDNTKKEFEQRIKAGITKDYGVCGPDREKEQMYLQLRELERRYELLSSQMVSMEDVMGIAAKMHKRYQPVR